MTEIYKDGWHPKRTAENDNRIASLLEELAWLANEKKLLKAEMMK